MRKNNRHDETETRFVKLDIRINGVPKDSDLEAVLPADLQKAIAEAVAAAMKYVHENSQITGELSIRVNASIATSVGNN